MEVAQSTPSMADIMAKVNEMKKTPKKARKAVPKRKASIAYKQVLVLDDPQWKIHWIYRSDTLVDSESAGKKIEDRKSVCHVLLSPVTGNGSEHFQLAQRVEGENGEELRPLTLTQNRQYLNLFTLADGSTISEKQVWRWKNRLPVHECDFFKAHPVVGILGDTNVVKLEKFKDNKTTVQTLSERTPAQYDAKKHKVETPPLPWYAQETPEIVMEDHLKSAKLPDTSATAYDRENLRSLANPAQHSTDTVVEKLEKADMKIVAEQTAEKGHHIEETKPVKKRPAPEKKPAKRVKSSAIENVIAEKWLTVYERAVKANKLTERLDGKLMQFMSDKHDMSAFLENDDIRLCVFALLFCLKHKDLGEKLPLVADLQRDPLDSIAEFVNSGRQNEEEWREKVWPKLRKAYDKDEITLPNGECTLLEHFEAIWDRLHSSPFTKGYGILFTDESLIIKYWMADDEAEKKLQMQHTNTILTAIHLWKTKGVESEPEEEEDDLFADF